MTRTQTILMGTVVLAALLWTMTAMAQSARVERFHAPERIELTQGKSVVVRAARPVSRVSLAAPDFADILMLSPTQVYLMGKQPGSTNLVLWDEDEAIVGVFEIDVSPDLTQLKTLMHKVLPGERNIQVLPASGSVTLSGTVSSVENLDRAMHLANSFSPGKVVNLMQVGGVHQVMLEVKIAEMSRSALKRLGVNFSSFLTGDFIYSFLNNMVYLDNVNGPLSIDQAGKAGNLYVTQSVNGMMRLGDTTLFLDALKQDGLVKILAEPTITCLSGKDADFLVGGEIPVPVPGALGTLTIEYKEYGVGLKFKPKVFGGGRISMEVAPEVSELDYTNAVSLNNYLIPALQTRKASTVIELNDGQTFAIAGLLSNNVREVIDKTPALGDIPILGTLFRSTSFRKNETELIILVTPHLAKPLNMAAQTLPTDGFQEPNDTELYLYGMTEGAKAPETSLAPRAQPAPRGAGKSGMEGAFGPAMPQ